MKNIISNFKTFFEFANYGFEVKTSKTIGGTVMQDSEKPINYIDSNLIVDELVRHKLNDVNPVNFWENVVQWGSEPGAIKLEITPLGSYRVVIRKMIKDLVGNSTWITKNVIDLDDAYSGHSEIAYAEDCLGIIENLNKENLDHASSNCENFDKLAWKLWNKCKAVFPSYIMFPIGMKKMSENYYKLIYEFKGGGVEAPTRLRAEQFNIDLHFNKNTGIIKSWGYDIDSDIRQHSWKVQISDFNECFAPSQPMDEIIAVINTSFMTY